MNYECALHSRYSDTPQRFRRARSFIQDMIASGLRQLHALNRSKLLRITALEMAAESTDVLFIS